VDRLKRLREPATVVALVGLALHFALTLLYHVLAPASFDLLLIDLAVGLVDPVLVALLAVLVTCCWLPDSTPHARGLTAFGLVLTGGLLATALGLLIAGVVRAPADAQVGMMMVFFGIVPWLTTGVLALGAYVALLRRPVPVASPAAAGEVESADSAEPVPAPAADPQLQPGWSPDAAVGAVWRRAGDAAAGAPATSWDTPGQPAGWWGPPPAIETPPYGPADQPAAGDWPPPDRG
jgi:hypothetical protein